jgi:hypothetical protein
MILAKEKINLYWLNNSKIRFNYLKVNQDQPINNYKIIMITWDKVHLKIIIFSKEILKINF